MKLILNDNLKVSEIARIAPCCSLVKTLVLFIGHMISGSSPPSSKLSARVEPVIAGVRTTITSRGRTNNLIDKQNASQSPVTYLRMLDGNRLKSGLFHLTRFQ